jgi:hypothetical protein
MFEQLIEVLSRIATALEAMNAANGVQPVVNPTKAELRRRKVQAKLAETKPEGEPAAETPAAAAEPEAPKPEAPKVPVEVAVAAKALAADEPKTVQDLIQAAQALLAANGNDTAPLAEINTRFGVKKLREIPTTAYAEVIEELLTLIKNAQKA